MSGRTPNRSARLRGPWREVITSSVIKIVPTCCVALASPLRKRGSAGTQPEQKIRIAGRGMPQLKSPGVKGDLYVLVKVQIPKELNTRQKSLLEQASKT